MKITEKLTRSFLVIGLMAVSVMSLAADTATEVEVTINEASDCEVVANDIIISQQRINQAIQTNSLDTLLTKAGDVHVKLIGKEKRVDNYTFRYQLIEK